jgi:predicted ATPase
VDRLQRARISNFRALGNDVEIDFGPTTVLVGRNGSGKSSVLEALQFVVDANRVGLAGALSHRNGIQSVRRWSKGHPFNTAIELSFVVGGRPALYGFELRGDRVEEYNVKREYATVGTERFEVVDGEWSGPDGLAPRVDKRSLALPAVGGDLRFAPLVNALSSMAVYSILPDVLRAPNKYDSVRPMTRHGENWASVLKDQSPDSWKPDLLAALKSLTGDIDDLRVSTAAGLLVVQFRHVSPEKKPKWLDAAQESDGTLRVAGIVSALLQEPSLALLAIEEPELTVHPGAIGLVVDYIRQATRRSQVIVTTHSPELLDLVEPEEIRVVERVRDADGEEHSEVRPLSRRQKEVVRDSLLSLGELVRTEGLQSELPQVP